MLNNEYWCVHFFLNKCSKTWNKYPKVGFWGKMVVHSNFTKDSTHCIPQGLNQTMFPPAVEERLLLHIKPALIVQFLKYDFLSGMRLDLIAIWN